MLGISHHTMLYPFYSASHPLFIFNEPIPHLSMAANQKNNVFESCQPTSVDSSYKLGETC